MSWFILALVACIVIRDGGCPNCGTPIDCSDVAIHDGSGQVDACDVEACETCVDACGIDCAVLESYPPQYSCGGGASWTVYDTCPDWEPPTTPYVTDIDDLGCEAGSGESVVATSTESGRIDVTHTDYMVGCCPETVDIDLLASGGTLSVDYALVADACDCACMLDVSYSIVDVPSGTWTLVTAPSGASTTVTVP